MTKQVLRAMYKEKRAALSERDRNRLNDLLLIQFQELHIAADVTVLMNFWPMEARGEVNSFLMADYLALRIPGLQIAYPVTDPSNFTLTAFIVNDESNFTVNQYGIAEPVNGIEIEPAAIDMVFVPLLAFDLQGNRVGYGKGFYDRFLRSCKPGITKIGFSYFEPVHAIDDISHFDVPLTTGICPGHIYEF